MKTNLLPILTSLVITATVASGQTTNYIDASVHVTGITGIATNYLDRVETSLKYAQQLRDAGYLGASIDILIEAVDELRERNLREPTMQVVTVTQTCQRTHCDAPWPGTYSTNYITNMNVNVEAP